ncbi:hypothetical protein SAMN05216324_13112 [Chryseobacterium limigenitum]|uniref:Uncharacterized protein n=1 Tax=Chryseobacterium limigenitum TaxID=1612149 RepID=A0A1K2IWZ1_9FLAO|nr:hypothetical protein SAMN05216324_13112 [Chryseobacterium limigenitum]
MKSVYLALEDASEKLTIPIQNWGIFLINLSLFLKKNSDHKNLSLTF